MLDTFARTSKTYIASVAFFIGSLDHLQCHDDVAARFLCFPYLQGAVAQQVRGEYGRFGIIALMQWQMDEGDRGRALVLRIIRCLARQSKNKSRVVIPRQKNVARHLAQASSGQQVVTIIG